MQGWVTPWSLSQAVFTLQVLIASPDTFIHSFLISAFTPAFALLAFETSQMHRRDPAANAAVDIRM